MTSHSFVKIGVCWLIVLLNAYNLSAEEVHSQDSAYLHFQQDFPSGTQYRCPPCGCNHDNDIFKQPGKCPHCQMPLVEVNTGFSKKVDVVVGRFLRIGKLGKVYTKVIYPIFAFSILLAVFLLFRRLRAKSLNLFLTSVILILALYGFKNQFFAAAYSLFSSHKSLFTPISFILMIGPMIGLYTKSMVSDSVKWKKEHIWLFVPGILMFLYYAVLLLVPVETSWNFLFTLYEVSLSHTEQIVSVVGGLISTIYSFGLVWKYEARTEHELQKAAWMNRFLTGMTILFLVWGLIILLNFWLYDFGVSTLGYNPLWVISSMMIAWILLEIMARPKLFLIGGTHVETKKKEALGSQAEATKYSKSGLRDAESKELVQQITEYMLTSHAYMDANITLDRISTDLKIYKHHVSQAINNTAGMNFYSFINDFRIKCAAEKLISIELESKTIESISFECGFSSKSTFNNLFKKKFGVTPSQYLREYSLSDDNR
ncbi:MAG: helix-turn-helix domain-containing protein [Cyclobacteriaceae bacterium]